MTKKARWEKGKTKKALFLEVWSENCAAESLQHEI